MDGQSSIGAKNIATYGFVALSSENDPFAQAEAPNTLHRHGSEFADHLRATERRSRPAYEPGAEQEVPNVQGDKQRHATPEAARRFERDVAVHKEIERAGTRDGDAVRDARRQRELGQGKHAELDERLHNRHAVIHKRLANATSEGRLVGQPFGGFSLVLESRILGYLDPFLDDRTSPLDSAELPLRNMCSHVFHERDSKTYARPAPERYPFVAVEAKASRTRKISKVYDFRKCGRHIMLNPVAKSPTLPATKSQYHQHSTYSSNANNAIHRHATVDCLNPRGPGIQDFEDDVTSYPEA